LKSYHVDKHAREHFLATWPLTVPCYTYSTDFKLLVNIYKQLQYKEWIICEEQLLREMSFELCLRYVSASFFSPLHDSKNSAKEFIHGPYL